MGLLAAGAMVAACSSGDDDERGLEGLDTPQFEPDTDAQGATSTQPAGVEGGPATSSPTSAPAGGESAETTSTTAASGAAPSPAKEEVSFDDPVGDAVGGLDDDPPAWADLAGATLMRQGTPTGSPSALATPHPRRPPARRP